MRKTLLSALSLGLALSLLPACTSLADDRPVLTIGDVHNPSARMDGEDQLGMEAALNACWDGTPERILSCVKSAVDRFVGDPSNSTT